VTLPDLPETDGSLKGSSPVRGNAYAGFLGGLGLATAPGYPTQIACIGFYLLSGLSEKRPFSLYPIPESIMMPHPARKPVKKNKTSLL
jgi:hypothetical protein